MSVSNLAGVKARWLSLRTGNPKVAGLVVFGAISALQLGQLRENCTRLPREKRMLFAKFLNLSRLSAPVKATRHLGKGSQHALDVFIRG